MLCFAIAFAHLLSPKLDLIPQESFADEVACAAYFPNGKEIAAGSTDGRFAVFDEKTGVRLYTLDSNAQPNRLPYYDDPHGKPPPSLTISKDGQFILTTAADGPARLWDGCTGSWIRNLWNGIDRVKIATLAPNGQIAATAFGSDTTIWNAQTGQVLLHLNAGGNEITGVSFAGDSSRFAAICRNGKAVVWSTASWKPIEQVPATDTYEAHAALSIDGSMLAATRDIHLDVWDTASGKQIFSFKKIVVPEATTSFSSVRFSPDGRTLLTTDGGIGLFDIATGRTIFPHHPQGYGNPAEPAFFADFSPDGTRYVAAQGWEEWQAQIFRTSDFAPLLTLTGHSPRIWAARLISSGLRVAAAAGPEGHREVRVVTIGKYGRGTAIPEPDISPLRWPAAFSADGSELALCGKQVTVWGADSGKLLLREQAGNYADTARFSHDGNILAAGHMDQYVGLWNVKSGAPLRTVSDSLDVEPEDFSPDDRTLATSQWGYTLLWNVKTGQRIGQLGTRQLSTLGRGVFSPDGKRIASWDIHNTVAIWNVDSLKKETELKGHLGFVWNAEFSPDSKRVVTVGSDNSGCIWDAHNGLCLCDFLCEGAATAVGFSGDGKEIWVAYEAGRVELRSSSNGELICTAYVFDDGSWLATTPDGSYDSSEAADAQHCHWVMLQPGLEPEAYPITKFAKGHYIPGLLSRELLGRTSTAG